MGVILEVEHLTKAFSSRGKEPFLAVNDISFSLKKGEILGIVGGSGCGKSTTAKLITRLIEPTSGTICYHGKDLMECGKKELRDVYKKIQMVFQNPVGSFDPRQTLGHGMGESLKNQGMKKEEIDKRIADLLVQCGLSAEFAERYPHEVSGGQCQRAALARALAISPEILICDEATSGLDVTVQNQIMELLKVLKEKMDLSCIFISHNLALIQMFCDRVLVMAEGKIVEEGTPDEIINHPQKEYTKRLIDSVL